jgi:sporulation protein YlmC with PRC-barrel domain
MTDHQAPVSWMTLEHGSAVYSSDGQELGGVGEVVADREKDIFSGVTIDGGLLGTDRFAPAAIIADISAEGVRLSIDAGEAEHLEAFEG